MTPPQQTPSEAHLFNFNIRTLSKLAEKAALIAQERFVSADRGNITDGGGGIAPKFQPP